MKTRRTLIAGLALAGSLTAGIGALHADAATPARPTAATRACTALQRTDTALLAEKARLATRIANVTSARDAAVTAGKTRLARELNHQLTELTRSATRLDARIAEVETKMAATCAPAPAATTTTTVAPPVVPV